MGAGGRGSAGTYRSWSMGRGLIGANCDALASHLPKSNTRAHSPRGGELGEGGRGSYTHRGERERGVVGLGVGDGDCREMRFGASLVSAGRFLGT